MQYWHCKPSSLLELKNSRRLGLPLQIIACLSIIFIHGNFALFTPQDEGTHWIHMDAVLCSIHIAQFAGQRFIYCTLYQLYYSSFRIFKLTNFHIGISVTLFSTLSAPETWVNLFSQHPSASNIWLVESKLFLFLCIPVYNFKYPNTTFKDHMFFSKSTLLLLKKIKLLFDLSLSLFIDMRTKPDDSVLCRLIQCIDLCDSVTCQLLHVLCILVHAPVLENSPTKDIA